MGMESQVAVVVDTLSSYQLIVTAAFVGVALWCVYTHVFLFYLNVWKLRHIPGPLAVPILGCLWDPTPLISVTGWLAKVRPRYGKIIRVFMGSRPYVVLMDRAAAREAFTDPTIFVKVPGYKERISFVFGDGLVTSIGEKHRKDRALFARFFTLKNIEKNLPVFCKQTLQAIKASIEPHVGELVEMEHFFSVLSLFMFSHFASSQVITAQDADDLSELTSRGAKIIGYSVVLGIPVGTWNPQAKKLKEDLQGFHYTKFDPMLDARMLAVSRGEGVPDDLLTMMIKEKMTRTQMYNHLTTLGAAAHHTTAGCAAFTVFLLARHPTVQQKLKAEIKRVMGDRREITPEDLAQLTYARQCTQESLRIYTIAPLVPRYCAKETKLACGVTVPADVEVWLPIALLNSDTDTWGSPIDEFRPERFEGITQEAPSKGYFPFGFSNRVCIGSTLAFVEIQVMLTLMLQQYTFVEDPSFQMKLGNNGMTLASTNGIKVRMVRDEEHAVKAG